MAKDCSDKPPMQCHHCKQEGHMARECPEKPPMACRRCGEEGHMVNECPKPETCKNCGQEGESLHPPTSSPIPELTITQQVTAPPPASLLVLSTVLTSPT